jgi:hypothetical protein
VDANATFTVLGPQGGTLQASTSVTRDTTSTTLNGAHAAGAATLTLASSTGFVVGRRYLLAGTEDAGGESVTVKAIPSSTSVTLVRPIRAARPDKATLVSGHVDFALTTAATQTIQRHCRVQMTWLSGTVAQPPFVLDFDVVRYWPETYLTLERLRAYDPIVVKRLPESTWWPDLRDLTWTRVLRRVAVKFPPGGIVGAIDLTDAHAYMVLAHLAQGTDEGNAFEARFAQELQATLAAGAVDADQDGAAADHEQYRTGVRLTRC